MREAGELLNAGKIAELSGLDGGGVVGDAQAEAAPGSLVE